MQFKFLKFAAIAAMCGMVFSACEQEAPQPTLSATISALNYNSAELTINSDNLTSYALLTLEADDAALISSAVAVFEQGGVKGELTGGETIVAIEDLKPETAYKFYIAAADGNDKVFEKFVVLDAVTPKDLNPALSAEFVEAGPFSITVSLSSANLTKYAFVASPSGESETPAGDLVFANGTVGELEAAGLTEVQVPGLLPEKEYDLFFAAADAEDNVFETVVKLTASTGKCTDEVSIYAIGKNSVTVTVNVPESVKEQNHVIKWSYQSLPMYIASAEWNGADAITLSTIPDYMGLYFNETSTFVINKDNSYLYEDDIAVEEKYFYPTPGEPGVLSLGEFAYDPTGEYEYNFYWQPGYYVPMFDYDSYFASIWGAGDDDPWLLSTRSGGYEENFDESKYWSGLYHRYYLQFEQPDPLDAEISISESLKANGGTISIRPSDNVFRCCYAVVDDNSYNYAKETYFSGDESFFQWLLSSSIGYYINADFEMGAFDIQIEDKAWASPGDRFHLLLSAHGDEQALAQKYIHHEFVIPEPSHPVPTAEAKQISSSDSVYEIAFNVKCPTGNAYEAKYACNYENEFQMALNKFNGEADQVASMLDYYGNYFTSEDIQKINSAEGLDLSFSTREDAVSMFGVVFYNDEGVASNGVLVTAKSGVETVEKVESPLFTSLSGDWTAKATILYTEMDYKDPDFPLGKEITLTEEKTAKVSFGNVSYPETLSDEVYEIYFNNTPYKTKEAVDEIYGQFKSYADEFNARVRARNRILAHGFDLYHPKYEGSTSELVYASAFDLFTDLNYSSATVEAPVMDFGPKWYLEIAKDGTVSAPFSREYMYSALNFNYNTYIFGGYDPENSACIYEPFNSGSKYGSFPVEISDDGNTITIKPIEVEGAKYYPNMLNDGSYYIYSSCPVITEIVLTRGYTGEAVVASHGSSKKNGCQSASHPGRGVRTPFDCNSSDCNSSDCKTVKVKPVTVDELKANVRKYGEQMRAKMSNR